MDTNEHSDSQPTVSRRAVTRAAAHATWAAPVIAVAAAAPAYAGSGPTPVITASNYGSGGNFTTSAIANVQFSKQDPSSPVASVQIQVTMTPTPGVTLTNTITGISSDFALSSATVNGLGVLTANFISVPNPILPGTSYQQRLLTFTVALNNSGNISPRGSMSSIVTPSTGTPGVASPATF